MPFRKKARRIDAAHARDRRTIRREDSFDIQENIGAGAKLLKGLLTRYTGDLSLALGAYNAGPGKVDEAGGVPAIPETTNYVREILRKLAIPPADPKPPVE